MKHQLVLTCSSCGSFDCDSRQCFNCLKKTPSAYRAKNFYQDEESAAILLEEYNFFLTPLASSFLWLEKRRKSQLSVHVLRLKKRSLHLIQQLENDFSNTPQTKQLCLIELKLLFNELNRLNMSFYFLDQTLANSSPENQLEIRSLYQTFRGQKYHPLYYKTKSGALKLLLLGLSLTFILFQVLRAQL